MSESLPIPEQSAPFQPRQVRLVPKRREIIPSFYEDHPDLDVVVTIDNEPIQHRGVMLTVRMVPHERRWAIQHNGICHNKMRFEELHEQVYIAKYQAANQPPDVARLRHVPTIYNYVAKVVDPSDESKLLDFVYWVNFSLEVGKNRPEPTKLYSPAADAEIPRDEVEGLDEGKPELMSQRFKTEEELRTDALALEKPKESAPCGKEVRKGYVHAHVRHCKKPECNKEDG